MAERVLPSGVVPERSTPEFTADSVPQGLLGAHHTTVWAELFVSAGQVRFVEEDPRWETIVDAGRTVVIVPNRRHHVEPSPDARFRVQFYALEAEDS